MKPAFKEDGVLTVGNSPSCNDGAAALVLMEEGEATRHHLKPLARIVGYAGAALAPEWFTIAPVHAIQKVSDNRQIYPSIRSTCLKLMKPLARCALAINRELSLDPAKVNVNGGAVALGHPIGATGARIITTLLYALEAKGGRLGLASLCIGGGEALAVVIERMT